jgi:tetratricopeptide (TPR) repeat protein
VANIIKIHEKWHFGKLRLSRKKKWIIGIIIVILLIGGSVAAWLITSNQKSLKTSTNTNQAKTAAEARASFNNVDKLVNTDKTDEAKAAYDELIKNTSDPNQKAFLLLDKATLYLKDSKYDEALAIAKEAENYGPKSSGVASYIAQIYSLKGDKQNAIDYYQKAVSFVDKTDPMSGSDIKDYQDIIKYLGGTT